MVVPIATSLSELNYTKPSQTFYLGPYRHWVEVGERYNTIFWILSHLPVVVIVALMICLLGLLALTSPKPLSSSIDASRPHLLEVVRIEINEKGAESEFFNDIACMRFMLYT